MSHFSYHSHRLGRKIMIWTAYSSDDGEYIARCDEYDHLRGKGETQADAIANLRNLLDETESQLETEDIREIILDACDEDFLFSLSITGDDMQLLEVIHPDDARSSIVNRVTEFVAKIHEMMRTIPHPLADCEKRMIQYINPEIHEIKQWIGDGFVGLSFHYGFEKKSKEIAITGAHAKGRRVIECILDRIYDGSLVGDNDES